jgi:hypothetical protein
MLGESRASVRPSRGCCGELGARPVACPGRGRVRALGGWVLVGPLSQFHEGGRTGMASSGKKKTTFAKLGREQKLRERRRDKEAKKDARRRATETDPQSSSDSAPAASDR